jgi:D-arabinose 1-dehydrogenase-like Zn-dependent alcohol dehydrogenase
MLGVDGTLVVIGLPGKPYSVEVGSLLPARRSLSGSMIGGIPEMREQQEMQPEQPEEMMQPPMEGMPQ